MLSYDMIKDDATFLEIIFKYNKNDGENNKQLYSNGNIFGRIQKNWSKRVIFSFFGDK